MINDSLLFDLLVSTILLIIGIRAAIVFSRSRTKYNLATLLVVIIFFIGTILSIFYPGKLNSIVTILLSYVSNSPDVGIAARIFLILIFTILLCAFLFYPDIKRFLNRRKMKNK